MAHLTRRLHAVAQFLESQPILLVTVELETLNWLRMPQRAMSLALAGLYGDQCVQQAAVDLRKRGHSVVVVRDLCVWSKYPVMDYPVPVLTAVELWPDLGAWIANNFCDDPVSWDGQPL